MIVNFVHICYNVTYYMDPDTAKFRRFKWFKFVPRLISMWGIRKCHHFNPKLPTVAIASIFTAYLIYVLYGPQYGKIKQIEVIKFDPRLILKRGIRKCQYFYPKLPTFAFAYSLPHISFTYYMDPKTAKLSRLELKKRFIFLYFIIAELFCFYTKSVTSIF